MLVPYSASPGFHWVSACPGEQTLQGRNKLHRSKLLLVSWLVLSYLLVKQWHLTVGPWRKHPVQMLDEVCLGFFPNSFSERNLLLWYLSSEELPALCQRGRACGAGYVAADTAAGSKLTHCTAMDEMQSASTSHPLVLLRWLVNVVTLEELPFWSSSLLAQARRCNHFLICWVLYCCGDLGRIL